MYITITGASDDLIEIDGDIVEEWSAPGEVDEGGALIAISDGTLLRIIYDEDGIWRITRLVAGSAQFEKVEGDVLRNTFDIAKLWGVEIAWVVLGSQYVFPTPEAIPA